MCTPLGHIILTEKQVLSQPGIKPKILYTPSRYSNHYATEAVLCYIRIFFLKILNEKT